MNRNWLLGSLLTLSVGTTAVAQERTADFRANSRGQVQKLSVLMKSKILIQDDKPGGQIVDIVLSEGGCVDYVVATYEDQYYVVPYSAVNVRYADQVVFVDIAPAQFQKVQFFSSGNWPDFYAADYRQQVFATFNVNKIRIDNDRNPTPRDRDRDDRDRDDADRPRNDRGENPRNPDRPRDRDDQAPGDRAPRTPRNDDAAPRTPREGDPKATPPREDLKPAVPRVEDRGEKPTPPAAPQPKVEGGQKEEAPRANVPAPKPAPAPAPSPRP
jgi:hypothetical protein